MLFSRSSVVDVDPAEAAAMAKDGRLLLVDVREADERRAIAPATRSLHIPLGTLAARFHELPRDTPVAFVCAAGGRSAMAARAASKAGIDARNVRGGMRRWQHDGVATKRG